MESLADIEQRIDSARRTYAEVKAEIARVIVGHEELIEQVFVALVCGGHCLLEGVPGLGKTLMVRSLGEILSLSFSRIQFTPDLMPADITGTNMLTDDPSGRKLFEFQRGPVFAHVVLADEINRATPKTQSALLEAMQEQGVTVGGKLHRLENPFMVLATQNPIEMEGTYPLPEAQVDRFFFKLILQYPEPCGVDAHRRSDYRGAAGAVAGNPRRRRHLAAAPVGARGAARRCRQGLRGAPDPEQPCPSGEKRRRIVGPALCHVRIEPARFAERHSGRQGARAVCRPAQCFFRRYSRHVAAELAPSFDSQSGSRRRRDQFR